MTATFHVGDAIEVMGKLPEKSVDLVLTSPPFLALRSYLPADHPDKPLEGGSQATPGEYVDWLLDVVEACSWVLAPHGSLCFELGDTYSGSAGINWDKSEDQVSNSVKRNSGAMAEASPLPTYNWNDGWPLAKSLSLIPESFRFAMVYGHNPFTGRKTEPWRLRNVIRWVRPNPPVGALGDKFRPATSELMVFCKAKDRFFDLDAVREPAASTYKPVDLGPTSKAHALVDGDATHGNATRWTGRVVASNPAGAPPLDWWNIPPSGYPGAHYAVWPPELLIKPIKAMCPEQVCRQCGEARRRIVDVGYVKTQETNNVTGRGITVGVNAPGADPSWSQGRANKIVETLGFTDCGHCCDTCGGRGLLDVERDERGYQIGAQEAFCPTCDGSGGSYRPGLVLDPFAGSGTTLAVATGHGRDAIGIDLDARNYELALDRVGPLVLQQGVL